VATALPDEVLRATRAYLGAADALLPGGITELAAAGSLALGAYRPGASDIDLIAVIDDGWRGRSSLIPRLRALHLAQVPRLVGRATRGLGFSACCNVSFVWRGELTLPVSRIAPIASHVGEIFDAAGAFDVNPVMWRELADFGIAVRGREPAAWELDAEPHTLGNWTRANLADYWYPLMRRLERRRAPLSAARVGWCLLGPARMHATLTTGRIVSKRDGARHAIEAFPAHAPILRLALARLDREPLPAAPPANEWRDRTVACMRDIIGVALG
jgi:hypothetical protein